MLKDLKLEGKELVYYKALHMGTTSYVIYVNAPALRACGQNLRNPHRVVRMPPFLRVGSSRYEKLNVNNQSNRQQQIFISSQKDNLKLTPASLTSAEMPGADEDEAGTVRRGKYF
jgi:hypothetical protein